MTITFTPLSNIKEVEVEGYGKVKIRPYGAGEELQITKNLRELEETQKQAEDFLEYIKASHNGDEEKLTPEDKEKFTKIQKKAAKLNDELNEIIEGTITSDDPKVAKRLFNELPLLEIRRLITTVLKGDNAEA